MSVLVEILGKTLFLSDGTALELPGEWHGTGQTEDEPKRWKIVEGHWAPDALTKRGMLLRPGCSRAEVERAIAFMMRSDRRRARRIEP